MKSCLKTMFPCSFLVMICVLVPIICDTILANEKYKLLLMCPKRAPKRGGSLRTYVFGPSHFSLPEWELNGYKINGHLQSLGMRIIPSEWQRRCLKGHVSPINLLSPCWL